MVEVVHNGGFNFHASVSRHFSCDVLFKQRFYHASFGVPADVTWVTSWFVVGDFQTFHQWHVGRHHCDCTGLLNFVVREFLQVNVSLSLIHISEPTRRTPISYAVFCLKKKKKTNN